MKIKGFVANFMLQSELLFEFFLDAISLGLVAFETNHGKLGLNLQRNVEISNENNDF